MDINFPLILMIATGITGLISLVDILLFKAKRGDKPEPMLVEQSKSFFPVLAIVFVLRSFIAEPFQIPSASMEPGLVEGDFILVSKFHYGLRMPVFRNTLVPLSQPERGDVMVFFPPNDPRYFIKRVIGLPGDHVVYKNHQLTINGDVIPTQQTAGEPVYRPTRYLADESLKTESSATVKWEVGRMRGYNGEIIMAGPEGEWHVPEGHYFMMGDNRNNSSDSRIWKFVPEENIVGKAVAVWMHWKSWDSIPSFDRSRWIP